ncbi:MAG: cytochrome c [Pseudomonadota bacterium]|nr:cytochrome c [Pseudomonadota bacterium]
MSMFSRLLGLFSLCVSLPVMGEAPGLGQPVSAEEIAVVDLVVLPNGEGLPAGSGSAVEGQVLYDRHCLACHGEGGLNGVNDRLAGGHGSLSTEAPVKTLGSYWPFATTVFDYIRRAMPYTQPGELTADEVYALTAYMLYINDIVDEQTVMDASTLPGIKMPNADNFVWAQSLQHLQQE